MNLLPDMPAALTVVLFLFAAGVIGIVGVRMAKVADRTGLGEAVVGGILLGMSTSLSGTVTSISAAAAGLPSMAVSNAIGGIAAQTVFLVIADMTYSKVNIEHAGADARHLLQTALLVLMLALPLAAVYLPEMTLWAIHPVSIVLFGVYWFGAHLSVRMSRQSTWQPQRTPDTRDDVADEDAGGESTGRLAGVFAVLAIILGGCGYLVAETGSDLSATFGISETVVGALLTATVTSLPELVTTVAAVRAGALQLAIAGIVGGNTFDVLFLSLSDVFYRDGSIYGAIAPRDLLMIVVAIVMTAILMMGLIMRDRRSIGLEGFAILVVYAAMVTLQIGMG